jgi:P4 family phage/plasmid primase-like protien
MNFTATETKSTKTNPLIMSHKILGVKEATFEKPLICLLDCERGSVQKSFNLVYGKLEKTDSDYLGISKGTSTDTEVDGLDGLGELIKTLKSKQALTLGVTGFGGTDIVSASIFESEHYQGDGVTRSKKFFKWPDTEHFILFDVDPEPGKPKLSPDETWEILVKVCPELANVGRLVISSSSSNIFNTETGECLKDEGGYHIYLAVKGDVVRFVEILKARFWLSGNAFHKLATLNAQTGVEAILERFLLDMTVFSPERIIFESGANLSEGLEQRRSEPKIYPGEVLDLDAVCYPTEIEIKEANRNRINDRQVLEKNRLETTVEAIQGKEGVERHIAVKRAKKLISELERGILNPLHELFLANGETVMAGELTTEHAGLQLKDPQEPDYRGGATVAKIYKGQSGFTINSFAHGQRVYTIATECTELDYFVHKYRGESINPSFESLEAAIAGLPLPSVDKLNKFIGDALSVAIYQDLDIISKSGVIGNLSLRAKEHGKHIKTDINKQLKATEQQIKQECKLQNDKEKADLLKHSVDIDFLIEFDSYGDPILPAQGDLAMVLKNRWEDDFAWNPKLKAFLKYKSVSLGIWGEVDQEAVNRDIQTVLESSEIGGKYSETYIRSVSMLIRDKLNIPENSWNQYRKGMIPFTNGVLDLSNSEILDHDPLRYFTWGLPRAHDRYAEDFPVISKWLDDVEEITQGEGYTRNIIRAFTNAVLKGRSDLQIFLHLFGASRSGKGTYQGLLILLIGLINTHTTSLKVWCGNNSFEHMNAIGKKLLIFPDEAKYVGDLSELKKVTGGDPLRCELKGLNKTHSMPYEGLVYLSSNSAALVQKDSAIANRELLIPFLSEVPVEKRDPKLLEKFEPELAAFTNWCLLMSDEEVDHTLKQRGGRPKAWVEAEIKYNQKIDNVALWVGERLEQGDRESIIQVGSDKFRTDHLFGNFYRFCEDSGLKAESYRNFADNLEIVLKHLKYEFKIVTPGNQKNFRGVKFKTSHN